MCRRAGKRPRRSRKASARTGSRYKSLCRSDGCGVRATDWHHRAFRGQGQACNRQAQALMSTPVTGDPMMKFARFESHASNRLAARENFMKTLSARVLSFTVLALAVAAPALPQDEDEGALE